MISGEEESYQLPNRMFLGSVDDSVARYPWTSTTVDLAAFNRCLIFHALLGPKVCFRIGNIVYNDRFLPALLEPRTSPLLSLAKNGFIQIQCRANGINESIASRLEIGTNSTKIFIQRKGWKPGTDLFRQFAKVEKELMGGPGMISYNPDFVRVFRHICDNLEPEPGTAFANVFTQWRSEFGTTERSRSNFEIVADRVERDYRRRAQAMMVINSINHYGYGIALRDADAGTAIETREIAALQGATSTIFGPEERHICGEALEDLVQNRTAGILLKNFLVPESLFVDPELWGKLAPLTNPDASGASREVLLLKQRFLTALARVISNDTDAGRRKALRAACREYSAALNSALGTKALHQLPLRISLETRKVSAVGAVLFAGWSGEAAAGSHTLLTPAVDVILAFAGNELGQSVLRGIDQFRTTPEAAARITGEDLRGPFQGLSIRRVDISSAELLATPAAPSGVGGDETA